jgi:hypothetical protein
VFRSRFCHQTGEAQRGAAGLVRALVWDTRRDGLSHPQAFACVKCSGVWVLLDRLEKEASCLSSSGSDLAYRAISTGRLNALLRVHLRPIDVVVFHGPQGRPGFEGGFPLRCLQRLSCPHIATLHCRWHDNRSTSGAFTPVLSY